MSEDPLKRLNIKTSVVKRMIKERESYIKQVPKDEARAKKLEESATTEDEKYAAKKANEVTLETRSMVKEAERRLETAANDLEEYLKSLGLVEGIEETAEARAQLANAREVIARKDEQSSSA